MTAFFARLREQPTLNKALILFAYGVVTFLAIYYIGTTFLGNVIFFRVFELLWFVHVLIICTRLYNSQREFLLLALIALSPGIVNNILGVLELRG
jgi:biotin transporter BioY